MPVLKSAPESIFVQVIVASRRARQLQDGAPAMVDSRALKPTRIAREELLKGLLEYEVPEAVLDEDKEAKRRR
jgi:DNA-directed RNA polymerase subunit K/omega